MANTSSYDAQATQAAMRAIDQGHSDSASLRELLGWTTCTSTSEMIEGYFAQHREDEALLAALVAIALEGEAPWAAANELAKFPASLLQKHRESLVELSNYDWSYLHIPAREALSKLAQAWQ